MCAVLSVTMTFSSSAQVPAPTIPDNGPISASSLGIQPHSSSTGTNESISPINGSLNVYIQLLSVPQRGGYALSIGLVHHSNSNTFVQQTNVNSSVQTSSGKSIVVDTIHYYDSILNYDGPLQINLPRLQFSYEYVGDHDFTFGDGTISSVGNIYCATNFQFTDWGGNKHPFENVSTCNWHLGGPNTPMINLTDASDGSFYRLDTSIQTDLKVYSKDGTIYHFYGFSNLFPDNGTAVDSWSNQENYYDARPALIVDPNGNTIQIGTTFSNNSATYTVTDTLSRTITITPASVSYNDSNGNPQTIQVETTPSQQTTSYNYGLSCFYSGPVQNAPYVTPAVTATGTATGLPALTTTTVTFPASTGVGSKEYVLTFDQISRMTAIQYPYGGNTQYDYQAASLTPPLTGNVSCTGGNIGEVAHKYECTSSSGTSCNENTTTYKPVLYSNGSTVFNSSMTITDPLGNQEVHLFSTTNPLRTNPEETDIDTSSSSGTLLRGIHNTYPTYTPSPSGAGHVSFDYDFPTQVTTTLYDASPSISTTTTYTYEPYAALPNYLTGAIDNPTEIDTTDYSGVVIQKISQQWEPASAFTSSPLILDRLQSRTTTDAAGTVSSTLAYGYDSFGNVTRKTVSGTNVTGLTTQYPRNSYGEITSVTDPRNLQTTLSYADSWANPSQQCVPPNSSAYPKSVANPLNQTTTYTYNACAGTVASITDPNGVKTSFTYDSLGRVLCKTVTDTNQAVVANTCDSYTDSAPSSITETASQSSTQGVSSEILLDGFGRVTEKSITSDPSGADLVDTTYDPNGRIETVSNAYRSYSDPAYGVTSYAYDALGRKLIECHPDNPAESGQPCTPGSDYASWAYVGNRVTSTDEVGNQWQQTKDALGRLTKLLEPNGNSQTASMEADYTYDALGDLLSVSQCGGVCPGTSTRQRTFSYNGLGQLVTAVNPESGKVCYGQVGGSSCTAAYDGDGNLLFKTDARGATTSYAYDNGNRLISKIYGNANGTPSSCYFYDSSAVIHGIGRLAAEWTQGQSAGNCPTSPPSSGVLTKRSITAYDAMGRVMNEAQCTPTTCANGTTYTPAYSYDWTGNLLSSNDGIGVRAFNYAYDGAGRLLTVNGGGVSGTLFSAQAPGSQVLQCPQSTSTAPYDAFGGLMNATFGSGLSVSRTYDTRLRLTCKVDGRTD